MKGINVKALGEYCGMNPHKAKKFLNDPESVRLTAHQKKLVADYTSELIKRLNKINKWANISIKATETYKNQLNEQRNRANTESSK